MTGLSAPHDVNVAYIDVADTDGELLFETFDLDSTPSVVFVSHNTVYYLNPGLFTI